MSATISACGCYRYDLTRETGEGAGSVLWVMLNPSTADATENDPTICKCIGFAKRWGFARLKVVNLFAFRATNPAELRNTDAPIDVENIRALLVESTVHDRVVFAWGGGLKHAKGNLWIAEYAASLFREARCFGINGDGTPKHPLYLKYDTKLVPYAQTQKKKKNKVLGRRPTNAEGLLGLALRIFLWCSG